MRMPSFRLFLFIVMVLSITACSTPKQPPIPMSSSMMRIGVAPFTQPRTTSDMLAGYIPEETPAVTPELLAELDAEFQIVLSKNASHTFVPASEGARCLRMVTSKESGPGAAIHRWSAVARCMNVDVLVVPQVYEWRERNGSNVGVVTPAGIILGFFVLDANNESLISRSHFDETQVALTDNLLETRKFFRRGGRWITGMELAHEGMERAVKDLGL